tara:strand:- start:5338 stop:5658 length:321 start_codon:yes stop_codon:yes gene_type:complete
LNCWLPGREILLLTRSLAFFRSTELTKDRHNIVRLSHKDWAGFVIALVTVLIFVGAAYQAHDRILTEIVVRQEYILDAQDEMKLEINHMQMRIEEINNASNSIINK